MELGIGLKSAQQEIPDKCKNCMQLQRDLDCISQGKEPGCPLLRFRFATSDIFSPPIPGTFIRIGGTSWDEEWVRKLRTEKIQSVTDFNDACLESISRSRFLPIINDAIVEENDDGREKVIRDKLSRSPAGEETIKIYLSENKKSLVELLDELRTRGYSEEFIAHYLEGY